MPNLKSIEIKAHETLVGFLCPECKAQMTSGIRDLSPDSEEEGWWVKPHCSECSFKSSTLDPSPYWWCIPMNPGEPVTLKMGAVFGWDTEDSTRIEVRLMWWDNAYPDSGPGLMWKCFVPLVEMANKPEESEGSFQKRIETTAYAMLTKLYGYADGTVKRGLVLEDPILHLFKTE